MQNELAADELAYMLMDKRIKGEIRDITYTKTVMEDVECEVYVRIRDRRPCYCGAELKEVWNSADCD